MIPRLRLESNLSRRSVLGLGIAASATALVSSAARRSDAAPCAGLKPPFEKIDKTVSADPVGAENPGKLAELILMTKNDQYWAKGQDIYFIGKSISPQIQRDGTDPACRFGSDTDILLGKLIRIPYLGTAKKGGCSAEHVLVGFEKPAATPVASYKPWQAPGMNPKELDELGVALVAFLKTDSGDSVAPTNWASTMTGDANQRDWRFRGQAMRIDYAYQTIYGVDDAGAKKQVRLFFGYQGGGAY